MLHFAGLPLLLLASAGSLADHLSKIPSGSLLYDIQNPFVFIPRVNFENHFDTGIGPHDASNYRLRMRPFAGFTVADHATAVHLGDTADDEQA